QQHQKAGALRGHRTATFRLCREDRMTVTSLAPDLMVDRWPRGLRNPGVHRFVLQPNWKSAGFVRSVLIATVLCQSPLKLHGSAPILPTRLASETRILAWEDAIGLG